MIYRVRAEQGLLVLNFDAEGYYAVDDHMNALDAYGEKDKLYVKVNSPTKYVYLIKFKEKGYPKDDVFVGNSGALSSIQRVNYVRDYEGEIREINGIEKVGYNEVEIRNFRGIEYGNLHLDRINVIIGANNAGKTTILDALYLLSDPYQKPPGFKNSLELLSYLHNVKKGNKFLYRFYNTEVSPRIKGDEIEVDVSEIFSKSEERRKEIKTLYMSYRLIPRYLKFIKENWEEISNYIVKEIFDEVNEISNEEYLTMSLEPFAGEYTFYLIRKDGKRVRLNDIGEGVRIFIVNRILYEYLKPGLLLWDDIETHLNPALLGKITAWFTDIPSQVVVTTHNLYVAYEISKDGKCIAVDLKNGQLKVKEIEDLKRYLDTGIDPRKIV